MNFDDFRGHIYLIDDDPSICRSLAFTLSSSHYSVQTFDGPRAFLKDSLPISPAVILLDMRMPEMSGTEFIPLLRKIKGGDSVCVVMLTAKASQTELSGLLDAGADFVAQKPFDPMLLPQLLQEYWELYRARI